MVDGTSGRLQHRHAVELRFSEDSDDAARSRRQSPSQVARRCSSMATCYVGLDRGRLQIAYIGGDGPEEVTGRAMVRHAAPRFAPTYDDEDAHAALIRAT
jgi:hypothetical protein